MQAVEESGKPDLVVAEETSFAFRISKILYKCSIKHALRHLVPDRSVAAEEILTNLKT